MANKTQRQQSEYNCRKKKNNNYINHRIKYVNMKGEINSKLKNLGYHNYTLKELKTFHEKNFINEGYSAEEIEKFLTEQAESHGITKYNSYKIKKLNDKLIFINNYIKFLEGKITRTN